MSKGSYGLRDYVGSCGRARAWIRLTRKLAYSVQVTVGGEGVELRSSGGAALLNWGVLKRWEETGGPC